MITFEDACSECIATDGFVREFNRLCGYHIGERIDGLNVSIDKACGYDPDAEAIPAFVDFVYEYVWLPLCRQNPDK